MKNLILILFFAFSTGVYAQNTYTVDNKPGAPADFSNLQDAIDAVPAGSTLLVQGGGYGNITIDKQLKLIGTGYYLDQNPNTQAYQISSSISVLTLNSGADGSIITGFTLNTININNCSNITVIYNKMERINIVDSSNLIFKYNLNYGAAYIYGGEYGTFFYGNCSNITFQGNYFVSHFRYENGADYSAIALINNLMRYTSAYEAYNNIFFGDGPCDNPQYHHNVFTGNRTYNHPCNPNNNNNIFNATDIFKDCTNQNCSPDEGFMLSPNSPAHGAGVNGVDCGIFGGGYRLSGIPNIPNIYEFTVPDTGYTNDGGIPVTVKVKANN